jgi:hypothetical protein
MFAQAGWAFASTQWRLIPYGDGLPRGTGSDLKASLLAIKQAAFVCIVTNSNLDVGYKSSNFSLSFSIVIFVHLLSFAGVFELF